MNTKKNDKKNSKQLQEILQEKLHSESKITGPTKPNLQSMQQNELMKKQIVDLNIEVSKLKQMLAQTTITRIHTEEDEQDLEFNLISRAATETNDSYNFRGERNFIFGIGGQGIKLHQKSKQLVPILDLSNLNQNKNYKNWYSYSKKLEDVVKILREKIQLLEENQITNKRCATEEERDSGSLI
ncbi:UNKNOWN [Stylonychia lemnae]|uniref:Uncharacterized protein n=1 Tax=Stylonychia lemnae TaxID=5949 RepID=A0A077ZVB7_STYLE|nr:UNKNOWN [Stylonychia lemnae]|eukprot:CDW73835.1 UNKNOWN [Stylonychia lemnae]